MNNLMHIHKYCLHYTVNPIKSMLNVLDLKPRLKIFSSMRAFCISSHFFPLPFGNVQSWRKLYVFVGRHNYSRDKKGTKKCTETLACWKPVSEGKPCGCWDATRWQEKKTLHGVNLSASRSSGTYSRDTQKRMNINVSIVSVTARSFYTFGR